MNTKSVTHNLPLEVKFCSKCTMNNQRPVSSIEFKHARNESKKTLVIGADSVCDACKYAEMKKEIDWDERREELAALCDRFRRTDGRYDVVVPGSGGKDSVMAANVLKNEFRMNPILITWPPALYTEIGRANFHRWLDAGFANYTYNQNRKLHKFLTKSAFLNLGHPFQPFILGQKNLAPRFSCMMDIPLVIYGENEAEYGNSIEDNFKSSRSQSYFASNEVKLEELILGGIPADELIKKYGFSLADLEAYFPVNCADMERVGTEVHYLGYFLKWHPQNTYYYSVENTGFQPNSERTEGSYSKYSSLDDKIDWLHYHTTMIKFGIGRATYDSSQEIRNGDITREEGIALVKRFDGEYPQKYLKDCCEYMGISVEEYCEVIEEFRSAHLWRQNGNKWELRYPIWSDFGTRS